MVCRLCRYRRGNAVIQVNSSGENCILLYGGSNRAITPKQIAETIENFEAGDYLVLQNVVNCPGEMVETVAEKGLRIVLNPSPFEENLRNLDYHKLSWLLVNEIEASQLTGESEPDKVWNYIHAEYPKLNVVMTMGNQGAWCFTPPGKDISACNFGKSGGYHGGGRYLYRIFPAGCDHR